MADGVTDYDSGKRLREVLRFAAPDVVPAALADGTAEWRVNDVRVVAPAGVDVLTIEAGLHGLSQEVKHELPGFTIYVELRRIPPPATVCIDCSSSDAWLAPCPYASEIHHDETPLLLCGDCRHNRQQEI